MAFANSHLSRKMSGRVWQVPMLIHFLLPKYVLVSLGGPGYKCLGIRTCKDGVRLPSGKRGCCSGLSWLPDRPPRCLAAYRLQPLQVSRRPGADSLGSGPGGGGTPPSHARCTSSLLWLPRSDSVHCRHAPTAMPAAAGALVWQQQRQDPLHGAAVEIKGSRGRRCEHGIWRRRPHARLARTSACSPAVVISFGEPTRSGARSKPPPERAMALSVPREISTHHWSALYSFPCAPPQPWSPGHTRRGALLHPTSLHPLRLRGSLSPRKGRREAGGSLGSFWLSPSADQGRFETRPEVLSFVPPGPALWLQSLRH